MRWTVFALALSLVISTEAVSQIKVSHSSAELRAKGFDVMSVFALTSSGAFAVVLRKEREVYVCVLKEGEMEVKARDRIVGVTYQTLEGEACRLVK